MCHRVCEQGAEQSGGREPSLELEFADQEPYRFPVVESGAGGVERR